MLMSLGFLQLQLVEINRNRKSVPLPHFASFGLIIVLSSPLGGWGLGSKFSAFEFKRQLSSFFFCDSRDKVTLRMELSCDPQ